MYEKLVNYAARQLELDPDDIKPDSTCCLLCQNLADYFFCSGTEYIYCYIRALFVKAINQLLCIFLRLGSI